LIGGRLPQGFPSFYSTTKKQNTTDMLLQMSLFASAPMLIMGYHFPILWIRNELLLKLIVGIFLFAAKFCLKKILLDRIDVKVIKKKGSRRLKIKFRRFPRKKK
jgi:hypothetical protein